MRQYNTIGSKSKQELEHIAKRVTSIAGFLREVGLKGAKAGSNYQTAKKYLQKYQIETSHWTGQAWGKDKQKKDWSQYKNNSGLKKHLICNRGYACESCKNSLWQKQEIPLEVHHIDGDRVNNLYDNLQLLCPNCHALTDNFRNKKRKK